jgi:hypothetical protein
LQGFRKKGAPVTAPRSAGSSPRLLVAVEMVDGALRVAGGSENRSLVVLQDLEPGCAISGVVFAGLRMMPRSAHRKAAYLSSMV